MKSSQGVNFKIGILNNRKLRRYNNLNQGIYAKVILKQWLLDQMWQKNKIK